MLTGLGASLLPQRSALQQASAFMFSLRSKGQEILSKTLSGLTTRTQLSSPKLAHTLPILLLFSLKTVLCYSKLLENQIKTRAEKQTAGLLLDQPSPPDGFRRLQKRYFALQIPSLFILPQYSGVHSTSHMQNTKRNSAQAKWPGAHDTSRYEVWPVDRHDHLYLAGTGTSRRRQGYV